MGRRIEGFWASYLKFQGWDELVREPISPEFVCGAHKWCIFPGYHVLVSSSRPRNTADDHRNHVLSLTHPENPHRRMLLFPFSLPTAPPNETISVNLDCQSNPRENRHACTQLALVVAKAYLPHVMEVDVRRLNSLPKSFLTFPLAMFPQRTNP